MLGLTAIALVTARVANCMALAWHIGRHPGYGVYL